MKTWVRPLDQANRRTRWAFQADDIEVETAVATNANLKVAQWNMRQGDIATLAVQSVNPGPVTLRLNGIMSPIDCRFVQSSPIEIASVVIPAGLAGFLTCGFPNHEFDVIEAVAQNTSGFTMNMKIEFSLRIDGSQYKPRDLTPISEGLKR